MIGEAHRTATAGLTVNLRIEGSGPPLLFLGGSNFDLSIKTTVFDSHLPEHFTVAAADPRGLGQTDQPDGEWSMKDYVNDALLVMDALGWTQVDVLGESFGAMVALNMALIAPERIHRMALAGRYDEQAPLERAVRITRAMPSASLTVVEGGHSICFSAPEPMATIIKGWLG